MSTGTLSAHSIAGEVRVLLADDFARAQLLCRLMEWGTAMADHFSRKRQREDARSDALDQAERTKRNRDQSAGPPTPTHEWVMGPRAYLNKDRTVKLGPTGNRVARIAGAWVDTRSLPPAPKDPRDAPWIPHDYALLAAAHDHFLTDGPRGMRAVPLIESEDTFITQSSAESAAVYIIWRMMRDEEVSARNPDQAGLVSRLRVALKRVTSDVSASRTTPPDIPELVAALRELVALRDCPEGPHTSPHPAHLRTRIAGMLAALHPFHAAVVTDDPATGGWSGHSVRRTGSTMTPTQKRLCFLGEGILEAMLGRDWDAVQRLTDELEAAARNESGVEVVPTDPKHPAGIVPPGYRLPEDLVPPGEKVPDRLRKAAGRGTIGRIYVNGRPHYCESCGWPMGFRDHRKKRADVPERLAGCKSCDARVTGRVTA